MSKNYDITKTKLIIWDLDDTFWNGNLSEGEIILKLLRLYVSLRPKA